MSDNRKLEQWKVDLIYQYYPKGDLNWLSEQTGQKIHALSEWARKRNIHRTININRNGTLEPFFNNTHESYYWLGMFAADGYVYKNGHFMLSQAEKDKEQVYKLANFLKSKVYIFTEKGGYHRKDGDLAYRVNVCDNIYGKKLIELFKIEGKKTYNGIDLSWMCEQDDRNLSFLIGFIDGDGSIYNTQIKIECHKNWLNIFNTLIKKLPEPFNTLQPKLVYRKQQDDYYVNFILKCLLSRELFCVAKKYNLPINKRKWDIIEQWMDINYITMPLTLITN